MLSLSLLPHSSFSIFLVGLEKDTSVESNKYLTTAGSSLLSRLVQAWLLSLHRLALASQVGAWANGSADNYLTYLFDAWTGIEVSDEFAFGLAWEPFTALALSIWFNLKRLWRRKKNEK